MDRLDLFTAAALAGFSARPNGGHGVPGDTDEEIGRKAVLRARGAVLALEEAETDPAPKLGSDKPTAKPVKAR